jgi:putative colanic acid biosynthesis acetyltransferase WcaF
MNALASHYRLGESSLLNMHNTISTRSHRQSWVDLSSYDNSGYDPGRSRLIRTVWYLISLIVFESGWCPLSRVKVAILNLFGAKIPRGVVIKPNVRIKYPWRLETGDHCWIGQEVWIDNLANVVLGSNVCLSQRAYICTGGHDYRRRTFDLTALPVEISDGVWVGACSLIHGGNNVGSNALVAAGSVVTSDVPAEAIMGGVPARVIRMRRPPEPVNDKPFQEFAA